LKRGKADFVVMGRALIADPDFPIKIMTGRMDEINWCIRCGECHPHDRDMLRRPDFRCTVNAFAGREADVQWRIIPAAKPKKVLVVGGGPGGMEAARVAALRGHHVTLYEKSDKLGGQIILAAKPPGKEEIEKTVRYLSHEIERLGVKIKLGVEVTPGLVEKIKPDAVILATGSTPIIPELPGVEHENVVTYWNVLSGEVEVGEKVVILGAGGNGAETADYLVNKGKDVTILEVLPTEVLEQDRGRGGTTRVQRETFPDLLGVATDLPRRYRTELIKRLAKHGVKAVFGAKIEKITDKGVSFRRSDGEHLIEADMVVIAVGNRPNKELYQKLFGKVPELYTVGDCVRQSRVMEAIGEGAYVALKI
jgi:NADPH-dependent 2,4-dienoyl-CoA reductase/sulfur reductase-like enzyme